MRRCTNTYGETHACHICRIIPLQQILFEHTASDGDNLCRIECNRYMPPSNRNIERFAADSAAQVNLFERSCIMYLRHKPADIICQACLVAPVITKTQRPLHNLVMAFGPEAREKFPPSFPGVHDMHDAVQFVFGKIPIYMIEQRMMCAGSLFKAWQTRGVSILQQ